MAKNRKYISHHPENSPDWYWTNGLHDAGIVEVESFEFPFDYNKFKEINIIRFDFCFQIKTHTGSNPYENSQKHLFYRQFT